MLTPETKRRIREVWASLPGLTSQDNPAYPHLRCAHLVLPRDLQDRLALEGLPSPDLWNANDAFGDEYEISPMDRRDCLIAMLDAGAFDDLGDA